MQFDPSAQTSTAVAQEQRYARSPAFMTRRVRRTIRRIDPWSVMKVSIAFFTSVMIVGFLASVILFYAAEAVGIIGKIQKFIQGVGWPEFHIRAIQVFRAVLVFGVIQVILWTGLTVLLAFLYNLVSDVVGGVELTMSERDS